MRQTKRRISSLATLIILGLFLPGLIGIFAVQARAVNDQARDALFALQGAATASGTSTLTSTPFLSPTATGTAAVSNRSAINLFAFVQAPTVPVPAPYVTLFGFSSIPRSGTIQIRGFVNSDEFVCTVSPCVMPLKASSRLIFRTVAASGEASDEIIATVNVTLTVNGYVVNIDSVSQFTSFVDSCSVTWGIRDEFNTRWNDFVQYPYELNTAKTLHSLAARLIVNGVVDASDCPLGGISLGLDWPTACGLEKSRGAMIAWQNQYDEYIWAGSRDHGVPPKVIKSLIEYESQFWPGNTRFYLDEFGLGQINQLGVDVLLRRDPTYYQRYCTGVLSDCSRLYTNLTQVEQAQIRGAVVASIDATCPTCQYGLDLDKAKQSVDLITRLVRANCQQVDAIMRGPVPPEPGTTATTTPSPTPVSKKPTPTLDPDDIGPTYEDMWRFTLVSYHSGISCFQEAYYTTKRNGQTANWKNLVKNLKCKSGKDYVDGLMNNLFAFDSYRYAPGEALSVFAAPTIIPTRTPIPTPTVFVSNARIVVQVYMDRNGNGQLDAGEGIDAMTVQVVVSNNERLTQRTQNGTAIFDMAGYPPDAGIDVSLPGLYRNQTFRLPSTGDYKVTFKFDQPALPTILP